MFFRTTQKVRVLLLLGSLCICGDFTAADDPVIPANNGVTFSHVYKIDLPKASDCKVEMDTIPVQDQGTEQMVSSQGMEGDNNIVFRHNIRLQTPKCDCESSESFQALLYRINGLEEEVTYLKSQCTQGCCGGGGSDTKCSGHGTLKQDTCSCVCDEGWEGEDCSRRSCPNECSDNGRCVDGQCVCYQGYAGADCSELLCPNDCNDKGRCVDGVCQCFSNFMGEDCSLRRCPNDCSGNGECDDGTCICEDGFTGIDCSKVMGPNDLRLLRSSEESLLVEWDEVPGAEYYLLTYHPEGDEGSIREIRVPSDTNSYLITGLTAGVKYIINVYAWIKGITSEPESLEATTEVSTVQKIRVVSQTEDSILVEWPNPSSEVDYFKLTFVTPEGQEQEVRVQKSSGAKTSYTITDLFPGTKYLIKVQAIKGNTAGKPSSVNGLTDIDAPTNLVTTSVTEDTATLSWDRVQAPVDGYMISYRYTDGQSQDFPVGADTTSYKLTGLRPGVEYTVYIWAVKGDRRSKKISSQAVTDIDAPTNLVTKSVTEDTATLSWDRVQAPVDGYMISYRYADGQGQDIPVGADRTSYKLTGLRPGVEYTVYIWAVKGDRSSKKISSQAVTDIDAPTNLVTKSVTEDTATLSWDRVQAPVDGYMISYRYADGQGQDIPVGADRTSYKLTGLRPGVEYTVYIWAVKGDRSSKKISSQAVTDIDAPTNLVTKSVTEDTATLSWDRVQAPVDGYMISYRYADGQSQDIPVGADRTSYKLTGLRPGVEYTVYIWAVKGDHKSKKISTQAVTDIDAPTNLVTKSVTEDTATLSWDRVQAPVDGYMISYRYADGQSQDIPVGADRTSYKLTGLRPGVEYTVYIWAVKGDRKSKKISTQAVTDIDAPTNLVTKSVTEDTATLSWDRVQAPVDGYMISYRYADGQSQDIPVGADRTSYKLTGLRPGVEYTVYIWAVKGDRKSKKISTQAVTDIDAPTNLVTKSVTEDTATLSWNRVQAPVDGYMISYRYADGQSQDIPVGADRTSYKLTGLRPGVEYTVYIWAVKGDRKSKKISTQAVTDIDAPTNLVTKSVTEDTATLSWNRVQAPVDGYMISYRYADGQSQDIHVGADRTSYKLTGLRPGVEYTVYIWAVKGDRSSKRTSTQAVTEIDAPTNLKVEDVQLNSGVLTWTPPLAVIDGYTLSYKTEDGSGQITERRVSPGERRFTLDGLELGKKYIVSLVAFRRNQRSRTVETTFTTVGVLFPFPMDCKEVLQSGNNSDGVYTIYLNNDRSKPMEVYCDMTTDGGGWIVLQRRNSGKLDFLKRWKQYIQGFGNLTDEFWLGLEKIYELTNTNTQYELRVDLKAGSESVYAVYDNFKIAPVRQKFKLTIGNYRGTAGDAMTYHQGRPFSTIDQDNDIALSNCALTHRGAWWYKNCHLANLNGRYGDDRHSVGVNWEPWKGHEFSIPFAEMKIRPHVASDTPVLGRKKRSLGGRGKSRRLESK